MRRRDARDRIAAAVLGTWLAASICGQHPLAAFQRVRRIDPVDLLIPRWRFFAPHPSMHDYRLFHQVVAPDGTHDRWRPTREISARRARHAVWFPERRAEKAQLMLCREILAAQAEDDPAGAVVAHWLVRSAVAERVREAGGSAFRYMVVVDAVHDPDDRPRCRYLSPVVTVAETDDDRPAGPASR